MVAQVKNLRNFKIESLILQELSLKNDPQMLLKNWSTTVTQKLTHKRYSKSDPQPLLKKWPTNVTQKLAYNCYSKSDPTWKEMLKISFPNSVFILLKSQM